MRYGIGYGHNNLPVRIVNIELRTGFGLDGEAAYRSLAFDGLCITIFYMLNRMVRALP